MSQQQQDPSWYDTATDWLGDTWDYVTDTGDGGFIDSVGDYFTTDSGGLDTTKIAGLVTGVGGVANALGLLPSSLDSNKPTGYQGKAEKKEFVRDRVQDTYDPNRRPGSGGQRYFSQGRYGRGDELPALRERSLTEAQGYEMLNKANPAQEMRSTPAMAQGGPVQGYFGGGGIRNALQNFRGMPSSNNTVDNLTMGPQGRNIPVGGPVGGFGSGPTDGGPITPRPAPIVRPVDENGMSPTDSQPQAMPKPGTSTPDNPLFLQATTPTQPSGISGLAQQYQRTGGNPFNSTGVPTNQTISPEEQARVRELGFGDPMMDRPSSVPPLPSPTNAPVMNNDILARIRELQARRNNPFSPMYAQESRGLPELQQKMFGNSRMLYNRRFRMAQGGQVPTQGYYLGGPTDGMADKVPATIDQKQPVALSDGEFVVPADVVSHLGNGNSNAGAEQLYGMMDRIRQARTGNKEQGKEINPNKFTPA